MESKNRKKVRLGAIATVTSISVLLGGIFNSPKELMEEEYHQPEAVRINIPDLSEDNLEEGKHGESLKQKLKRLIYHIPVKVRTVFFVPLWIMGTGILFLFNLLSTAVLKPIWQLAGHFLLQTLLLLLIAGICIKILFPDMPWSKIFSKKTLLIVILGSLTMSLCDIILPHYIEHYKSYVFLFKTIMGLIILFILLKPFITKKLKNRISYDILYDQQILNND